MTQRLIYVVGPSGAGKDSVLQGLRDAWGDMAAAHWARRTITRPAEAGGETHESVSVSDFLRLQEQQAFELHWQANGLHYGVRAAELDSLDEGGCVFVNGSREYLVSLISIFPAATIVHITASTEALERRLKLRGREGAEDIALRLQRKVEVAFPEHTLHIHNNSSLPAAVAALRAGLALRLQYELTSVSPSP